MARRGVVPAVLREPDGDPADHAGGRREGRPRDLVLPQARHTGYILTDSRLSGAGGTRPANDAASASGGPRCPRPVPAGARPRRTRRFRRRSAATAVLAVPVLPRRGRPR